MHNLSQGDDESIDFVACVVKGKGGANTHLVTESSKGWLCTVVSCTYGDSFLVEQLSCEWNVDAIEHEGHDRNTVLGVADEGEARNECQLLTGVLGEVVLMGFDVVESDVLHVVECCAKRDGIGYVWGSCFESCWWKIETCLFECHVLNHVAATLPRR